MELIGGRVKKLAGSVANCFHGAIGEYDARPDGDARTRIDAAHDGGRVVAASEQAFDRLPMSIQNPARRVGRQPLRRSQRGRDDVQRDEGSGLDRTEVRIDLADRGIAERAVEGGLAAMEIGVGADLGVLVVLLDRRFEGVRIKPDLARQPGQRVGHLDVADALVGLGAEGPGPGK